MKFPMPALTTCTDGVNIATSIDVRLKKLSCERNCGLTDLLNFVHDPACQDDEIGRLRLELEAVSGYVNNAYGWDDLDLGHGFHETRQGVRFTISHAAREGLLDRLLALNHERYAEEVRQGLHEKGAKKKAGKKAKRKAGPASTTRQPELDFGFQLTTSHASRR